MRKNLFLIAGIAWASAVWGGVTRVRLADWQFMRANGSAGETNSAAWAAVRVPHDWGVDKPFDPAKPYGDAYLEPTGVGWYRRTFRLDGAQAALVKSGGHVFFESNGAMSHSQVWVNGHLAGGWPYGYTPFRCDLTPHLDLSGANELVVRCHNHTDSSRWYTGGGLYRECRLAFCPADYLLPGSVAITTPKVSKEEATVEAVWEMSRSGRKSRVFTVRNPRLWDIDDPHLYTLDIEGETFRYGIRTIAFFADARGFQLNGRRVPLNGVCLHHDLGVLGAAYNRAAMKRRFLKLKEAGVNAIRCSHNQEDPDFLDLCDELGLLVKDEVFDEWRHIGSAGKRADGYSKLFDAWHERDTRAWVRADRNHPSVIMWSLGNEIADGLPKIAPTAEFIATARALDRIVKSEDKTRPTTNANNHPVNYTNAFGAVLDVFGFNYHCYKYGDFKKRNPGKPFFGSETQCMIASRGEYVFPVTWGWTQQKTGFPYSSGYGTEACGWNGKADSGWACPPDAQWFNMDKHPECMGEFVWTGWDYLGGPYWADEMVKKFKIKGIHSCATGFFDLAGFPKDTFWLYQSRWRPDFPSAHILPHWNWPERAGQVTPVHVFTSGDEGELFLNGRSLGRRRKDPADWKKAYRLSWDDVVYEPGTLRVVTYKNGKPWAEDTVATTGPAARIELEPETKTVRADGEDLVFVNLAVKDAEGRVVPRARTAVTFAVEGPGEIVATDNGDETDFTSFHALSRETFNGRLQAIVRARPGAAGTIRVTATAAGLPAARAEIPIRTGLAWDAEKTDVWQGRTRHVFTIDGAECWVVEPAKPRAGNPWIWCTEWPGAFHERTAGKLLLEEGYHFLYAKVGHMCLGSPRALEQMDAFYKFFTAKGLAKKGALSGVSRGGLYCFRFAWRHPERVACLYGDHAVLDFKSWPMRVTDGTFNPAGRDVKATLDVYGFKTLEEALAYRFNPVDYEVLKVLAAAKIPVMLVIGEADDTVPPEYNSNVLVARYRSLGGDVTEIRYPNCKHHPHGVDNPRELADWIIGHTR